MTATLFADDLTGACDAGALLAGRGPVRVLLGAADASAADADVVAVDTESRQLDAARAAKRVSAAARDLGPRLDRSLVFKKIDSTLRGPVGAELEALLATAGRSAALLCPAFPGQRRVVRDGVLRVDGVPAHESAIGRDPAYPGATSDVAEIVRRGAARPVSVLPIGRVRAAGDGLTRTLAALREEIAVADAETDADLDRLATAAAGCPRLVLAGSAGLARAMAAAHGYAAPPAPLPEGRAWLFVAGSLHPATRAQIAALEAAGVSGVRVDPARDVDTAPLLGALGAGQPALLATADRISDGSDRLDAGRRLADAAADLLRRARPDLVVVTGGDCAWALLRALGATRLELRGAPGSGLALGDAWSDRALPLLTKAGGFGPPDLFLALLAEPAR